MVCLPDVVHFAHDSKLGLLLLQRLTANRSAAVIPFPLPPALISTSGL
jgi:hypothetical protein